MSVRDESLNETNNDYLVPVMEGLVIDELVDNQLEPLSLRLSTEDRPGGTDRVYSDNESLWTDILTERLRASVTITLQDFSLLEWYPRTPGLYWTQGAAFSRAAAQDYLLHSRSSHVAGEKRRKGRNLRVFAPYGKGELLRGGFGCLRLQPQPTAHGNLWFWCATSGSVAHQGFPVALSDEVYTQVIDKIAANAFIRCTLIGKLRFLPDSLLPFLRGYRDVPRLYLLVEEIRPALTWVQDHQPISVTGAVSFLSDYEGRTQLYASLVTFYPQESDSLEEASRWLEEVYVQGMYRGKILTDYDQCMARFANAPFSLDKVLRLGLDIEQIEALAMENHRLDMSRKLEQIREQAPVINHYINTGGGAYVGGNVNTGGGDFTGRDSMGRDNLRHN